MRKVFISILFLLLFTSIFAEKSPHGNGFKIDCTICHTADNWNKIKTGTFNHNKTRFPLVGQHKMVGCKSCHPTLEFRKAKTECVACHIDVHQGTLGRDCERCHTPTSWIVSNVKQIHQQKGFALVGMHQTVECNRCHKSASQLRFDNMRNDCYSCHQKDYDGTNHRIDGFGTDCFRCHNMTGRSWSYSGKGFEHGFFALIGGHKNVDCISCHPTGEYRTRISPECNTCHQHVAEYANARTTIPAHTNTSKIGKYACTDCHSSVGWNSIKFKQHDSWFGIYSGNHKGAWDRCIDCHNNDATYKTNCKRCHD